MASYVQLVERTLDGCRLRLDPLSLLLQPLPLFKQPLLVALDLLQLPDGPRDVLALGDLCPEHLVILKFITLWYAVNKMRTSTMKKTIVLVVNEDLLMR